VTAQAKSKWYWLMNELLLWALVVWVFRHLAVQDIGMKVKILMSFNLL